jgi:hypothetical protein
MVDRGAAVCSDFFWMIPARAAAGLWCRGLSGVGGCSSSESEAAGIGGRVGNAGDAIAGAAGAAAPFVSSI